MTCEDMKKEIENIKKELIRQINESDIDMQEILRGIIKVSSKYPDQKELIEFVVILNDSLSRDSKTTKNNIIELIDRCFMYKIKILDKIDEVNKKTTKNSTIKKKISTVATGIKNIFFNKLIIPLAIIAFIFLLYVLFPEQSEHFFKEIFPKINKIL